jgi:hypothetical protein
VNEVFVIQGRELTPADVVEIRELIAAHPDWSRRRLSECLAVLWDWRNDRGQLKDMAARSLLLKLAAREWIALPPRRQAPSNRMARRAGTREGEGSLIDSPATAVAGTLHQLGPLQVREVSGDSVLRAACRGALERFHYRGGRGPVGENLQYAITDTRSRLLACLWFGSAAWACRPRDAHIGWSADQKRRRLGWITNNTRFLILPEVRVPHLASWILGQVLRRLPADWTAKYGHPILLVETFVERDRFRGTCYQAANWIRVGATTGRSRQDRRHRLEVPVKDVYLYPLHRRFRQELAG